MRYEEIEGRETEKEIREPYHPSIYPRHCEIPVSQLVTLMSPGTWDSRVRPATERV